MPKLPDSGSVSLPPGVIFNAYPDSTGPALKDAVAILGRTELKNAFSLFYILPTFFNSDLDRGFSVIDYDLNRDLVSPADLNNLQDLKIDLKLDLVLNHLSVNSPQFKDLYQKGRVSYFNDFFIDWNEFWQGCGSKNEEGFIVPHPACLKKLFMRKTGLPVMEIRFPDGTKRFFWNTFYREINYSPNDPVDFRELTGLSFKAQAELSNLVNQELSRGISPEQINLAAYNRYRKEIIAIIESKVHYKGQLDLNAGNQKVWDFYDQTMQKLKQHGARIVRLDAFAYLHKEPGRANFFNRPETWGYLERLNKMAQKHGLVILPEIHAEYGSGIHNKIAKRGYPFYDFFFPGLIIDALDRGLNKPLLKWIDELITGRYKTISMLGCHDGIPALDLKGKTVNGEYLPGLLSDSEIDGLVNRMVERGGLIKNLYGPDGKKTAYYQVNTTFFSALGENEQKMLLARAVQLFMPGTPQVWYLDLFAGKNNYEAVKQAGPAGHKEINRTNLSPETVERGLKRPVVLEQLKMIRLCNTSPAFQGKIEVDKHCDSHMLKIKRSYSGYSATLSANLRNYTFQVEHRKESGETEILNYP